MYGFPASFLKRAVHSVVNSLILIEPSLDLKILIGKKDLIKISTLFPLNTFKSRDGSININEFTTLCTALFRNEAGKPYKLDQGENNSDE